MGRWIIVVFAATALVVVPSATPQVVVGRTVYLSPLVPSGASAQISVSCPSGFLAVSAGVARTATGVMTLAVRPLNVRMYSFRFANPGGNGGRHVTASAACRRVRASGTAPYLKQRQLRPFRLRVGPSSLRRARLTCPSGTIPAGAGFDFGPGGTSLSVRRQTQTLQDVSFAVFNRGSAARTVSLFASCLTVVRPVGAGPERLETQLTTFTVPVRPGTPVLTKLCPRGWLSLGVGYVVPPGVELAGAAAVARTGRWSLTSSNQGPVAAQIELVCGRLA